MKNIEKVERVRLKNMNKKIKKSKWLPGTAIKRIKPPHKIYQRDRSNFEGEHITKFYCLQYYLRMLLSSSSWLGGQFYVILQNITELYDHRDFPGPTQVVSRMESISSIYMAHPLFF